MTPLTRPCARVSAVSPRHNAAQRGMKFDAAGRPHGGGRGKVAAGRATGCFCRINHDGKTGRKRIRIAGFGRKTIPRSVKSGGERIEDDRHGFAILSRKRVAPNDREIFPTGRAGKEIRPAIMIDLRIVNCRRAYVSRGE